MTFIPKARDLRKSTGRVFLYVGVIAALGGGVFLVFPLAFTWIESRFFSSDAAVQDRGAIFAGVGALFSAIAFAGLLITIVLQARELSLQRQELQATRGELQRQANALELQQFENLFFHMLQLHHEIVRGMVDLEFPSIQPATIFEPAQPGPERRWEGRGVLKRALDHLRQRIDKAVDNDPSARRFPIIVSGYELTYEHYGHHLGHYFRNLYHVVKLVDRSRLAQPRTYSSLVRAQLSGTELQLLFANCLSKHGAGFKHLVQKYAMLEHLPLGDLVQPEDLLAFDEQAFGDRAELLAARQRAAVSAVGIEAHP